MMKNLKSVSETKENIVVRLPHGTCAAQYSPAFLTANGMGDRKVGRYMGAPTLSITAAEYVVLMDAQHLADHQANEQRLGVFINYTGRAS